jgi:DNA-binding transcriptional MerR regulator
VSLSKQAEEDFVPTYRSGIAARLAGVPVETLRVWERRYGVVGPKLDPRRHRLYSADDVSRLALIKQLVDLGSPIGAVANLTLAALRQMRSAAGAASQGATAAPPEPRQTVRVALVGKALTALIGREGAAPPDIRIVARCTDVSDAAEALRSISADVLVVELATLQSDAVAAVGALTRTVGARRAVVAFRFGPASVVGALRDAGHLVARAPLALDELDRLCRDAAAPEVTLAVSSAPPVLPDTVPARRFDDLSLARLAGATSTLYCECPHHVAELLLSLGSFEQYSSECASRGPEDVELHRYLQRVAGTARALFEDALIHLAQAEGIALPSPLRRP